MDRPTGEARSRAGPPAPADPTTVLQLHVGPGPRPDLPRSGGKMVVVVVVVVVVVDGAEVPSGPARRRAAGEHRVQADPEHLPFARDAFGGADFSTTGLALPRTRVPLALAGLHRVLVVGSPLALTVPGTGTGPDGGEQDPDPDTVRAHTDEGGTGWTPSRLVDVVVGAGFDVEGASPTVSADGITLRAVRARTLADTVGPGMRLLVCGVNPSWYSADAGVGYARPGNRFWAAAMAAGIVDADRDAVAALEDHGVGMTDFVKRPSRTAAEVTSAEYRAGFARVERLVTWLRPGAVCFSGLSGWRDVVDPRAVAGPQPRGIGGRPAYVMPSTSGLNARTPLSELAHHLGQAWLLGDSP